MKNNAEMYVDIFMDGANIVVTGKNLPVGGIICTHRDRRLRFVTFKWLLFTVFTRFRLLTGILLLCKRMPVKRRKAIFCRPKGHRLKL